MEKIDQLIEIATQLQFEQQVQELNILKKRMLMPQQELLIPFVGEFSAGKTTLLNSLMDSKKLETASKPTTATIFQIRFGAKTPKAIVYKKDGSSEEVDNIEEFKNENADADNVAYVEVHDTSTKVPETTLIIDTPGLSSPDPKHIEVLTTFLPQSDAVMLVSDINQQLTRTILEFIATTALVKKPIYLILTKSGTKTPAEVEQARAYAATTLPNTKIACVDSIDGNIEELNTIFQDIQQRKNDIVANAIEQRTIGISKEILKMIDTLLDATKDDQSIAEEIKEQEDKLRWSNRAIDSLEKETIQEMKKLSEEVEKEYTTNIESRLIEIVESNSSNYDAEVQGIINSTSIALLSNLKTEIQKLLVSIAQKGASEDVELDGIEQIDLSTFSLSSLDYDIELNKAGSGLSNTVATLKTVTGVIIKVLPFIIEMMGNKGQTGNKPTPKPKIEKIEKIEKFKGKMLEKKDTIIAAGDVISKTNTSGLEKWIKYQAGKPARTRAIKKYIQETILPYFTQNIKLVEDGVVGQIIDFLRQQASEKNSQMTESLKQLKEQAQADQENYQQRVTQLEKYKQQLN